MAIDPINLSDYINITVTPLIDDKVTCTSNDNCLSFEVDAKKLSALPGKKLLYVTLTSGTFADGTNDGGTGREDGYAPFELTRPNDSKKFTQVIKKLQPAAAKPDEKAVVKGVASLALEEQNLAVLDALDTTVATADAATVIVARVHFALLSLKAGERYLLTRRDPLLVITAEKDVSNLCLVYREDTPPGLEGRVPGSHYFQLSVPNDQTVAHLVLDFYTLNPANTTVVNRGGINGVEGWKPFTGLLTPATDGKTLRLINSTGNITFALASKQ